MNQVHKWRRGQDIIKWLQNGDARALVNELVDMVYEWEQTKNTKRDENRLNFHHPAVVDVSNTTGGALARFAIVQLGNATVIDPTVNLGQFQEGAIFAGVAPSSPPDTTRWGVLLEPLPSSLPGSSAAPVGRCAVSGIVPVQVNFGATTDKFAGPAASNTTNLVSNASSGVPIVWPNPAGSTGMQWALVMLTQGSGGLSTVKKKVTVYSTAGTSTWTKAAGCLVVDVEVVGGGGGSGGTPTTSLNTATFLTSGGGGGGYARKSYAASSVAATATITVGAAGTAGAAGGAGGTGGTSSFNDGTNVVQGFGGGGSAAGPDYTAVTIGTITLYSLLPNTTDAGAGGGTSGGDVGLGGVGGQTAQALSYKTGGGSLSFLTYTVGEGGPSTLGLKGSGAQGAMQLVNTAGNAGQVGMVVITEITS